MNTATGAASCLSLSAIAPAGPYTFSWNNGQSSTFSLSYVVTVAAGVSNVTGTGTVTSGGLLGATGIFVWVYTALDLLDCLTTGVTSENGPSPPPSSLPDYPGPAGAAEPAAPRPVPPVTAAGDIPKQVAALQGTVARTSTHLGAELATAMLEPRFWTAYHLVELGENSQQPSRRGTTASD